MAKQKFYVVWQGKTPGVYRTWADCAAQTQGFPGARFKAYPTLVEAEAAFADGPLAAKAPKPAAKKPRARRQARPRDGSLTVQVDHGSAVPHADLLKQGYTVIYTDGGAEPNPGPGGFGVVILDGDNRHELSAGFRMTTNNRMELMGWIAGLDAVTAPAKIAILSDSKYVGNAYTCGDAIGWRERGWRLASKQPAKNVDLWQRLLSLCDEHEQVCFGWVKGHAGIAENERCDELASEAMRLPADARLVDEGYIKPVEPRGLF